LLFLAQATEKELVPTVEYLKVRRNGKLTSRINPDLC
jgi:hypothetical protein